MPRETAYITTPIYYVNDRPHIGHAYTTTVCDVWARFMRLAGRDVFFLTGTDEHGVKVEKTAAERGVAPQDLADDNAAEFQRLLGIFNLSNDDFIRTTQQRHTRQVQAFVRRLIDSEDVYLDEYEGWYDEGQEEFIPEARAREQDLKSAISGKPLVRMKEANYFFRLSAYQDRLQQLYDDQPGFVRPEARRNEMLGRLRDGLQDIPVSRTSFSWGIPVPGDETHVLWVWLDALSNYITTLSLGEPDSEAHQDRGKYWPATYHVIGKEILFFHALFWPAVLMALDFPLPRCVYAHSFWISEGQKMSKSLGNFIDLETISRYHERYGLDAWRYYMATQGPLGATDADFAAAHFHDIYSTDLVNTVGNSASRVTAMLVKYFDGVIPEDTGTPDEGFDWPATVGEATDPNSKPRDSRPGDQGKVPAAFAAMDQLDLAGSIRAALDLIRQVDAYINATEPFKLAKDESPTAQARLGDILHRCAEGIRIASLLLWSVMPQKMEELWDALGVDPPKPRGASPGDDDQTLAALCRWGQTVPGTKVSKVALFPRVEEPIEPAVAKA